MSGDSTAVMPIGKAQQFVTIDNEGDAFWETKENVDDEFDFADAFEDQQREYASDIMRSTLMRLKQKLDNVAQLEEVDLQDAPLTVDGIMAEVNAIKKKVEYDHAQHTKSNLILESFDKKNSEDLYSGQDYNIAKDIENLTIAVVKQLVNPTRKGKPLIQCVAQILLHKLHQLEKSEFTYVPVYQRILFDDIDLFTALLGSQPNFREFTSTLVKRFGKNNVILAFKSLLFDDVELKNKVLTYFEDKHDSKSMRHILDFYFDEEEATLRSTFWDKIGNLRNQIV